MANLQEDYNSLESDLDNHNLATFNQEISVVIL